MAIPPFKILSIGSGCEGLGLGVKLVVENARIVCYVEREAFAVATLKDAMQQETLDDAPVWDDARTFDGRPWHRKVDCLIAGYPCQPFSVAGKLLGTKDPRHLWPTIRRIIAKIKPPWVFLENVSNHIRHGFYKVARDLRRLGYHVEATLLTAEEVGAPHGRERLFVLANDKGRESWEQAEQDGRGSFRETQKLEVAQSYGRNPRRPECEGFRRNPPLVQSSRQMEDPCSPRARNKGRKAGGRFRTQALRQGNRQERSVWDTPAVRKMADTFSIRWGGGCNGPRESCGPQPEMEADGRCRKLGNSENERLQAVPPERDQEIPLEDGSGKLADPKKLAQREQDDKKCPVTRENARQDTGRGGLRLSGAGNPLSNTCGKGLQERKSFDCNNAEEFKAIKRIRGTRLFPPGPGGGDREEWERILKSCPLAAPAISEKDLYRIAYKKARKQADQIPQGDPWRAKAIRAAVKSAFRRMAHGLTGRPDSLQLAGNSVVAVQAAVAFLSLWAQFTTEQQTPYFSAGLKNAPERF